MPGPERELAALPWPILAFVEDHLSNDDRSSDAQLAAHFVANGLTRAQALAALRFRRAYQDAWFLTHDTPIRCAARRPAGG